MWCQWARGRTNAANVCQNQALGHILVANGSVASLSYRGQAWLLVWYSSTGILLDDETADAEEHASSLWVQPMSTVSMHGGRGSTSY
jgi:hypothetical protein